MKKTLLSLIATFTISVASFAQLDVAVTSIDVPAPNSTINIGDSIDITFTFGVVVDTLKNGDTASFTITLPGQTAIPFAVIMSQDIPAGFGGQIQFQQKLPTSGVSAGSGDICIKFIAVGTTIGDANASNDETCSTYTWQDPNATTGIGELSSSETLYISNNSVVYNLNTNQPINFTVYNTMGQLVKSSIHKNAIGTVDISDLNNGIYIVNIQSGSKSITKKVIK